MWQGPLANLHFLFGMAALSRLNQIASPLILTLTATKKFRDDEIEKPRCTFYFGKYVDVWRISGAHVLESVFCFTIGVVFFS